MNVEFSGSSGSEVETSSDPDDYSGPPPTPSQLKRSRPTSVVSSSLAAVLDRTKVSDRNAMYIIAAAAESLGHTTLSLAINKESIKRARHKHREIVARGIRASFDPNCPLTVPLDGNMLSALMSKELVDRLAVLVSGDGTMKLLGVSAKIAKWNWTGRGDGRI